MPRPIKTLEEHLLSIQSCSYRWRVLSLKKEGQQPITTDSKQILIVPVRCKSKFCPICRKRNFNIIRHKFKRIDITTQWRFATLTSKHSPDNSEEELLKLEDDFRKLTKHLKRKFPELKYFAVKELSPSGMWHIHLIWNIFIDIKDLSSIWNRYSGAYRCDLQRVRNPKGIVTYIFNYMMKKGDHFEESKMLYENGLKKFTSSWKFFEKDPYESPYELISTLELTTDELKEFLLQKIESTNLTADDFKFDSYPYADELIQNLFYYFYCQPDQQQLQFENPPEEIF